MSDDYTARDEFGDRLTVSMRRDSDGLTFLAIDSDEDNGASIELTDDQVRRLIAFLAPELVAER